MLGFYLQPDPSHPSCDLMSSHVHILIFSVSLYSIILSVKVNPWSGCGSADLSLDLKCQSANNYLA